MKLLEKYIVGFTILGVAGALSGCGAESAGADAAPGTWEEVVEAANEEGSVSFYSGMSELQNTRLTEAFNEKYPDIKVDTLRGAGELYARVESELETGVSGADVFALGDTTWFTANEESFLPLSGPASEDWLEPGWITEETAVIATATPSSMLVWNTNIFPEGFESWDDLLAPEVKGEIGLRTDVTKSVAGYMDMLETELGEEYLIQLGSQSPKVYPSVVPMTQAVAAGEVGVTNSSLPATVHELAANGAPIDWQIPSPGFAFEFGVAALETAGSPNAGVVFVDFIMSEEGQEAINGEGFGASQGLEGIKGSVEADDFTMLDSAKFTPEVLDEWRGKLAQYYGH